MKKWTALVLLGLTLTTTSAIANDGHNRLMRMPTNERTKALGTFLGTGGKTCAATRSFFQGFDKKNNAYWNVACTNGEAYSIQIPDDRRANSAVVPCHMLKTIGVECFKKF